MDRRVPGRRKEPDFRVLGQSVGKYRRNLVFCGDVLLQVAPVLWFGVAYALFLLVRDRNARGGAAQFLLIAVSLFLVFHADFQSGEIHWSPYQKLQVVSLRIRQYAVLVNNVGYMTMANVSPDVLAHYPAFAQGYKDSAYDAPWRFIGPRDRVLIVGAGAGNDADAALRNGARQIDAVEIDPEIYALGKRLAPRPALRLRPSPRDSERCPRLPARNQGVL